MAERTRHENRDFVRVNGRRPKVRLPLRKWSFRSALLSDGPLGGGEVGGALRGVLRETSPKLREKASVETRGQRQKNSLIVNSG